MLAALGRILDSRLRRAAQRGRSMYSASRIAGVVLLAGCLSACETFTVKTGTEKVGEAHGFPIYLDKFDEWENTTSVMKDEADFNKDKAACDAEIDAYTDDPVKRDRAVAFDAA
jgi:hypothetical protein